MIASLMTVFRREISAYFNAAIAYIFIIVFVLLNGGLYMTQFFLYGRADMRPFFSMLPYILCVFLPAVTMRLWAEEKKGNTLELLLTFPMPTHALVLGKYLASLVFYFAALAATLTIPIMLYVIGRPDMGAVFGGYLGAIFMGSFFLAIGIFISGLCRDQIVAFIVSMMICFGLFLAGTEYLASSIDGWIHGLGSFLRYFVGAAAHYDTFGKGVIDTRDFIYFMVGTVLFLVLNGYWLEGRMRPGAKKIFTTTCLICAGIFLMGNWLFGELSLGRFDLTQGKIYTIAPATKQILKDLKAPVTAKYYVSSADKMPTGMKTLEQDVVDKLSELSVVSGGKFQYKIFHMDASNITASEAKGGDSIEQQLQQKGIQPFQVRAIDSDEVAVKLVYSAISLGYKEKADEMIPQVLPGNLHELEYSIMSKIYRMTMAESPKIAMVAPYEEKEMDPQMAALLSQLGTQYAKQYRDDNYELLPMALEYEGYQVNRIRLTEEEPIPEGTKTLVMLEPLALNDRQLFELNHFLASGGSVFLAVQNYEYKYDPQGGNLVLTSEFKNPNINTLIREWGLEVDEQILVDEQSDVINLSGGQRIGPFEVSVPVKLPIHVLVTESGMNPEMSITSNLSTMFYLWGTAINLDDKKISGQGLKVETLLRSSHQSWTVPFSQGMISPQDLARVPESKRGPLTLSVYAQGQFKDVYKDKEAPAWPVKEEAALQDPNAPKEDKSVEAKKPEPVKPAPGKLLLVGASQMFQKHLARGGGHLNFFMNAVDALTLGEEMVTIRSKQPTDRSIGKVSGGMKIVWRVFVSFLIPIIIAVIGTFRMIVRRQSKQNYLRDLVAAS